MAFTWDIPEFTIFGFKSSIIISGVGGGILSSFVQDGGFLRGIAYAVGGSLSAIFLTGWTLSLGSKFFLVSREAEHALAFLFGLSGYLLAKGIFAGVDRARARAADIVDAQIDKRIGK